MGLTGFPDGPPVATPAAAIGLLAEAIRVLEWMTGEIGSPVSVDPGVALSGRAALLGLTRGGQTSAGGATRLLRASDGWCAVTLSRPTDFDAVPAILATDDVPDDPWSALANAARLAPGSAAELVARCRLLGVPAAALPSAPAAQLVNPFHSSRIAPRASGASLSGAMVVDLSSMWAGPLCAHLLGRAGARVIKVEGATRPDGARRGDPRFFSWLHDGHEQLTLDFHAPAGRASLATLLAEADVVIEASRPRALAQFGLAPEERRHRAGQVWLSITGHGRAEPELAAFGDDAAVAGGLVGWHEGEPVFCADAVADPLTGVCGALAVSAALLGGGGLLVDLSMRAVAAAFASVSLEHGPHDVYRDGNEWRVHCPRSSRHQAVLPPRAPASTEC
jgi:crotonobetainyl-CoA:carnitine CoA-transferase CaiB-like acyl-CoA transferase